MARTALRSLAARARAVLLALIVLGGYSFVAPATVHAAQMQNRSVTLSNPLATATGVEYLFKFHIETPSLIGSIRIQFCDNTPLEGDPCSAPAGFDASASFIASQTGATGFLVSGPDSTPNDIVLTRPPALEAPVSSSYNIVNITNPDNDGPLFTRVETFSSSDGTGPVIDFAGMALEILPSFGVSAEVPPYLLFCLGESITNFDCNTATEPFSELGDLTPNITSAAQSQIVVATNGQSGFTMRAAGGTMTSGNNTITAMSGGTSAKGTSQFGLNLTANGTPAIGQTVTGPGIATVDPAYDQPDHFRFNSGDIIATAPAPNDFRKFTVSYIVNVPKGQPGGVYSTTITYVCLANF